VGPGPRFGAGAGLAARSSMTLLASLLSLLHATVAVRGEYSLPIVLRTVRK